jgi:hypothetical protein
LQSLLMADLKRLRSPGVSSRSLMPVGFRSLNRGGIFKTFAGKLIYRGTTYRACAAPLTRSGSGCSSPTTRRLQAEGSRPPNRFFRRFPANIGGRKRVIIDFVTGVPISAKTARTPVGTSSALWSTLGGLTLNITPFSRARPLSLRSQVALPRRPLALLA